MQTMAMTSKFLGQNDQKFNFPSVCFSFIGNKNDYIKSYFFDKKEREVQVYLPSFPLFIVARWW